MAARVAPKEDKKAPPPSCLKDLLVGFILNRVGRVVGQKYRDDPYVAKVMEELKKCAAITDDAVDIWGEEVHIFSCYVLRCPSPLDRNRLRYSVEEEEYNQYVDKYITEFVSVAVEYSLPFLRPLGTICDIAEKLISQAAASDEKDITLAKRMLTTLMQRIWSDQQLQDYLNRDNGAGWKSLADTIYYRQTAICLDINYDYTFRDKYFERGDLF